MLNYLYLDYGGLPQYRRELKYSLISLKVELDESSARIAVYTDVPQVYRNWPVTVVDIAADVAGWSSGGLYHHRIKPAAVKDALRRFEEPVLLLDSDSIVRTGFHAEAAEKLARAVVVNRFEKNDPLPVLAGFETKLPHLGAYRYAGEKSRMYNSGLIGMRPEHAPLLDDTLTLIDTLIGRAKTLPMLEQFALSEALRLSATPVAEIFDTFLHYWQGRRRLYMANEIEKALAPSWDDLSPPKKWAELGYWKVRAYSYWYGLTHPLEALRCVWR